MGQYISRFFVVRVILVLALAAGTILAGGNLDTGFNLTGRSVFNLDTSAAYGNFSEIAVIAGGKFLVVGRAEVTPGYYAITLNRYNSDGSPDTSFGVGGIVVTDTGITSEGMALAVQPDGKIVVAANSDNYPNRKTGVLRYSADGVLDTAFGTNGIYFSELDLPDDIEILGDGKMLISGVGAVPNTTSQGVQVARINPNGTPDTTFGTAGLASSTYGGGTNSDKMAIQPDGKIVVSGNTNHNVPTGIVHRFMPDGTPDPSFGTGGFREFQGPNFTRMFMGGGVTVLPTGKILVGGAGMQAQMNNSVYMLVRLNADGSDDAAFGTGGYVFHAISPTGDAASDIEVQSDGKILMSGATQTPNAVAIRLDAAGAIDPTFGTGGVATLSSNANSYAVAILLQGSDVIAVGRDQFGIYLSRVSGTGAPLSYRNENFNFGKNDQARSVAVQPDGKIVAAGFSSRSNGDTVFSVARLLPTGGLDPTFGSGGRFAFNEVVASASEAYAVRLQSDGKILVTGRYSPNFTFSTYFLFVARLNANGTLDPTFGTSGGKTVFANGLDMIGYDIDIQPDGKIVVGGTDRPWVGDGIFEFNMMAARLSASGTPDAGFGNNGIFVNFTGGPGNQQYEKVSGMALLPNGKIVLAGTHLLRVEANGTLDAAFSPTPVPVVFPASGIELQPDGKLLLSGATGGNLAVARYNGNGAIDSGFGLGGVASIDLGGSDVANALYLETNGDIVAGGTTVSGIPSHRHFALARFRSNGAPDTSFGNGGKVITNFGGDSQIFGLARQPDGKIVAAGDAKISIDRDYAVARYSSRTGAFDFDGDGRTDVSVFRPSVGEWYYAQSGTGQVGGAQFGTATDKPVPADFTGDGKTDVAVWRPATGEWFVLKSEDSSYFSFPFGQTGDIPMPGDFDADGKADAAVFRPASGVWYVNKSSGGTIIQQFGVPGDIPVVADYDGDGRADIAIYRPVNGQWWIDRSSAGLFACQFGNSTDMVVPGDYTGDGKADVALFRPSTGEWFVLRSEDQQYYAFPFGLSSDIPAPGDFDGDGKFDQAVFRPSTGTWFAIRSTGGFLITGFGVNGDRPVPSAFIP